MGKSKYFNTILGEEFRELGEKIFQFRTIVDRIDQKQLEEFSGSANTFFILHLIDSIYQDSLDAIFDKLCNCNDLTFGKEAIDGINKSLNIRRGFTKLEEETNG